jgi:phenylalanyl-tRNA synthetase beta chain
LNSYLYDDFIIDEVKALLEPIGFGVIPMGEDLSVTVPSFRPDCSIEVDIIEEVARHYGYSKVDKLRLNPPQVGGLTRQQKLRRGIRAFARDNGFNEMWGSSMLSPTEHSPFGISDQAIALSNPLAREESVLRRSLLPSVARALVHNSNRQISPIRLFELGKVFEPRVTEEGLPLETERLEFLLTSPESATNEMTRILGLCFGFFKLPQPTLDTPTVLNGESILTSWPMLHPTRSAAVVSDGIPIGVLGELDRDLIAALTSNTTKDRVAYLELDLGLIFMQLPGAVQAKAVSAFPPSEFDLAFFVPDTVGAQEMVNAVRSSVGEFCESVYLFDSYKSKEMGEGIKSLAVKIRLQNPAATVTDKEIQDAIARVASHMDTSFGAKLRTV